jgi:hypothetical protein
MFRFCPECSHRAGEPIEMELAYIDYEEHLVEAELLDEYAYSHGYAMRHLRIPVYVFKCREGHIYKDIPKTGHVDYIVTEKEEEDNW